MHCEAASLIAEAFSAGVRPDPLLSVSEWADEFRMLSQKASAEPGRWRTSRTPYLKEIMDCLSPRSKVETVVFMKGAQVGGTECGNNWIGYIIDHAPGPALVVMPILDLAKAFSKQRLKTLIEESPKIRGKVKESRERDSGNTQLMKEFQGGFLKLAGANSAASLRSMPVRYLLCDEVDAYPGDVEGEGDPLILAEKRTGTFARKKKYFVSTPTIEGRSRIASLYAQTDRRRYWVPCPHCAAFQWLKWDQVRFDKIDRGNGQREATNVRYICESCEKEIREHHKTGMLAKGEWRAEEPGVQGGRVVGFHLSALYSPVGWYSWTQAAQDFLNAKDKPEEYKGWINTTLGETWKEKSDAPEWERLFERRELYPLNRVSGKAIFLTCGVDVQKDRLELEIVGWGKDKQSWSIDYRVILGDTSLDVSDPKSPWRGLDEILMEEWPHESGASLRIRMLGIDSGFNTQHVYNWARRHPVNRVIVLKGVASASLMLGQPSTVDITIMGKKLKRGFRIWPAGVGIAKGELYSWLKLPKPIEDPETFPPGYCHFPEYGPEFFKQITAEQLVVKVVRGFRKYEWEKIRDRNEALDTRVYARIAASAVGLDRLSTVQLEKILAVVGIPVSSSAKPQKEQAPGSKSAESSDAPGSARAPSREPPPPPRRRSSFWD
jgi:phage terminase large subunit GpA-like protein